MNETDASTVRLIFRRYAELGSVALLKAELDRLGTMSKRRQGAMGQLSNGKRFARGAFYLMRTGFTAARSRKRTKSTPASMNQSSIRSFGRACRTSSPPTGTSAR